MGGTEAVIGDSIMASGDRPRRPGRRAGARAGLPSPIPKAVGLGKDSSRECIRQQEGNRDGTERALTRLRARRFVGRRLSAGAAGHLPPNPGRSKKMRHQRPKRLLTLLLALPLLAMPAIASAERIQASLIGYEEVPSVSTVASGDFKAQISPDGQTIDYELTYSGLQAPVQQAHIHVAQLSVNGSIVIWLCQTNTPFIDPTNRAPVCPQQGTVRGTITSANVIAGSMTSQQLKAGGLAEVIAAIRAGAAYANVHTSLSPGGEIRAQIHASQK